jgi:hypothetical protein
MASTTPGGVPGIYDRFKVYAKSTGASFLRSAEVPLLESTELSLPFLEMALRGRSRNRLVGPANGIRSKVKWKVSRSYGSRTPGTPVQWNRRGSLEFLGSSYCHEFGTLQFIEAEIKKQIGSVWSAERMAQQFDSVLENGKQDLYVDIAEYLEEQMKAVPVKEMEDGASNLTRSLFMGLNEWTTAHGDAGQIKANGAMPGITRIEDYDVTVPGSKFGPRIETYTTVGKNTTGAKGSLFEAIARGFRNINFKAYPLAEGHTQGTMAEGHSEVFASIEGHMLIANSLAAHDNVISDDGDWQKVYGMTSRFKGAAFIDVPGLEDVPICPDYLVGGAADPASYDLYVPTQGAEQVYRTELTSANAKGPRFYVPYQSHVRLMWDEDSFMAESPMYELRETTPDALVCYVKNDRNMHFESFRRGLVIRPGANITGF